MVIEWFDPVSRLTGTRGVEANLVVHRDGGFLLDVSLVLLPGTTTALLGPNGAGKSTLVDVLAGLIPLDEGRLVIAGTAVDDPSADIFVPPQQRGIGIVFQDYLLFEHLSVLDNVAFGLRGGNRSDRRRRARTWLDSFDLADLARRSPSQISGGQAQRVALARALASDPKALLLDEPLAALDVTTRSRTRQSLAASLRAFDGPRMLITHDPTDAFLLADRLVVLENGRVTQTGTPDEIRRHPATGYVADLAGTNLFVGRCDGGMVVVDGHPERLQVADTSIVGKVLVTIHPSAVALHPSRPDGSPRNTWRATVVAVEPLGDTVRVELGFPLPIRADVTPAAAAALDLRPGIEIWVAVKATEIDVTPR